MNIYQCKFVTDGDYQKMEIIAENEGAAAEVFAQKAFTKRELWHKLSGEHTRLPNEYKVEVTPEGKLNATVFSILVKALFCFYAKEHYDEYK